MEKSQSNSDKDKIDKQNEEDKKEEQEEETSIQPQQQQQQQAGFFSRSIFKAAKSVTKFFSNNDERLDNFKSIIQSDATDFKSKVKNIQEQLLKWKNCFSVPNVDTKDKLEKIEQINLVLSKYEDNNLIQNCFREYVIELLKPYYLQHKEVKQLLIKLLIPFNSIQQKQFQKANQFTEEDEYQKMLNIWALENPLQCQNHILEFPEQKFYTEFNIKRPEILQYCGIWKSLKEVIIIQQLENQRQSIEKSDKQKIFNLLKDLAILNNQLCIIWKGNHTYLFTEEKNIKEFQVELIVDLEQLITEPYQRELIQMQENQLLANYGKEIDDKTAKDFCGKIQSVIQYHSHDLFIQNRLREMIIKIFSPYSDSNYNILDFLSSIIVNPCKHQKQDILIQLFQELSKGGELGQEKIKLEIQRYMQEVALADPFSLKELIKQYSPIIQQYEIQKPDILEYIQDATKFDDLLLILRIEQGIKNNNNTQENLKIRDSQLKNLEVKNLSVFNKIIYNNPHLNSDLEKITKYQTIYNNFSKEEQISLKDPLDSIERWNKILQQSIQGSVKEETFLQCINDMQNMIKCFQQNLFLQNLVREKIILKFMGYMKYSFEFKIFLSQLTQPYLSEKHATIEKIISDSKLQPLQEETINLEIQLNEISIQDPILTHKIFHTGELEQQLNMLKIKLPQIWDYIPEFKSIKQIQIIQELEGLKIKDSQLGIKLLIQKLLYSLQEEDEQLYNMWLDANQQYQPPFRKNYNLDRSSEEMTNIYSQLRFPEQQLESFVFQSTILNFQELTEKSVKEFISREQDLKVLQQLYFELLNRCGEWDVIIKQINAEICKEQKIRHMFNKKTLFYLYWSNCDQIRKYKSTLAFAKYNAVPLVIPKWPTISQSSCGMEMQNFYAEITKSFQQRIFNKSIYMVLRDSFGILSFGIGNSANEMIGKSQLLNIIFEKRFEINDRNPFSAQTIDIDFDLSFRPSRNFCIADVSGELNKQLHPIFFDIFSVLIIHLNAQTINETIETQNQIFDVLNKIKEKQPLVILLIRDAQFKENPTTLISFDQAVLKHEYLQQSLLNKYTNIFIVALKNIEEIQEEKLKNLKIRELKTQIYAQLNLLYLQGKTYYKINKTSIIRLFQMFPEMVDEGIEDIEQTERAKIEFFNELNKSQEDFFDPIILPMRQIQRELKIVKDRIWTSTDSASITVSKERANILEIKQSQTNFSDIMKIFCEQVLNSKHWYTILIEISLQLKDLFDMKLKKFKQDKDILTKRKDDYQSIKSSIKNINQDIIQEILKSFPLIKSDIDKLKEIEENKKLFPLELIFKSYQNVKLELEQIQQSIDKQSISIEIFWRELLSVINKNQSVSQFLSFEPSQKLYEFLHFGESFEMIDGDNMQINYDQLKKLAIKFVEKKIFVLSILGPQSSGKSTLLNYLFGCQFSASVGRCTRGVYGSITQINHKNFDYLLILDTEGLQDPDKPSSDFDKTIILFCLSVSQIVLINFKSEINLAMRNLLEICIFSMNTIRRNRVVKGEAFLIFNQSPNGKNDIISLKDQVNKLKTNIVDANQDTMDDANILCSEKNTIALGGAFNDRNDQMFTNYTYKEPQSSFAQDTLDLCSQIYRGFDRIDNKKQTFESWLSMAQEIWSFIEIYPSLFQYGSILEITQDNDLTDQVSKWKASNLNQKPIDIYQGEIEVYCKSKNIKINTINSEEAEDLKKNITQNIIHKYDILIKEVEVIIKKICEDRSYNASLQRKHIENIIKLIKNIETEAKFHLNKFFMDITGNRYKQEGIKSIQIKVQGYQANFPEQEIENFIKTKHNKQIVLKDIIDANESQTYIEEWAEYQFNIIWKEIIDNLKNMINLPQVFSMILGNLKDFYYNRGKTIKADHQIQNEMEKILEGNLKEKLPNSMISQIISFYDNNIIRVKNREEIIFKHYNSDKINQSLLLKINQLERTTDNYLKISSKFQVEVKQRGVNLLIITDAIKYMWIYDKITEYSQSLNWRDTQEIKLQKLEKIFLAPFQSALSTLSIQINQRLIQNISDVATENYFFEYKRINNLITILANYPDLSNGMLIFLDKDRDQIERMRQQQEIIEKQFNEISTLENNKTINENELNQQYDKESKLKNQNDSIEKANKKLKDQIQKDQFKLEQHKEIIKIEILENNKLNEKYTQKIIEEEQKAKPGNSSIQSIPIQQNKQALQNEKDKTNRKDQIQIEELIKSSQEQLEINKTEGKSIQQKLDTLKLIIDQLKQEQTKITTDLIKMEQKIQESYEIMDQQGAKKPLKQNEYAQYYNLYQPQTKTYIKIKQQYQQRNNNDRIINYKQLTENAFILSESVTTINIQQIRDKYSQIINIDLMIVEIFCKIYDSIQSMESDLQSRQKQYNQQKINNKFLILDDKEIKRCIYKEKIHNNLQKQDLYIKEIHNNLQNQALYKEKNHNNLQKEALNYLIDPSTLRDRNKGELEQGLSILCKDFLDWDKVLSDIVNNLISGLTLPDIENKELQIKLSQSNSLNKQDNWKQISQFSNQTVESAFKEVEKIMFKINKDSEYLGCELDIKGEIYLHQFGMYICWRLLCYVYRNIYMQPIKELKQEKSRWQDFFIGTISKDELKLCRQLSKRIVSEYFKSLKSKYLINAQLEIKKQLNGIEHQFLAKDILDETDLRVFQKCRRENDSVKNIMIPYIDENPIKEIQITFELKWQNLTESKIYMQCEQIKNLINIELEECKQVIQDLLSQLRRLDLKTKDSSLEFFHIVEREIKLEKIKQNEISDEEVYYKAAFQLIDDALKQEAIDSNWCYNDITTGSMLQLQYKNKSQQIKLNKSSPLLSSVNWNDDQNTQKIGYPIYFVEEISEEIDNYIKMENIKLEYTDLLIADIYNECKIRSIGCIKTCKFCGRKCDKDGKDSHKYHESSLTHYVRGMKGVRIEQTLSNKFCDEIKPQTPIKIEHEGQIITKTWEQIMQQDSFKDWCYKYQNPPKKFQSVNFVDIWNKYGEEFCKYYGMKYEESLNFSSININSQIIHYLICIDDSGSMSGDNWIQAKNAAVQFIKSADANHKTNGGQGKMTVIKFNGSAQMVIGANGPENISADIVNKRLNYQGGGTDFYDPMRLALDQILKYQKFSKQAIAFFTDGYASDPSQQLIPLIAKIPRETFNTIEFHGRSLVDSQILDNVKKLFPGGSSKGNISIENIQSEFLEILDAVKFGVNI